VIREILPGEDGDALLVTPYGYRELQDELGFLRTVRRAEMRERLRQAREGGGDLADNNDLLEAFEEQERLERRIARLETHLAVARIVDGACRDGAAAIGTSVRLRNLVEPELLDYELVGSVEADPSRGKISGESPVGRALLGQRAGDVVEVETPRGLARFEVVAVSPSRETARSERGGIRRLSEVS
jgi:transcription elongation factor GreA